MPIQPQDFFSKLQPWEQAGRPSYTKMFLLGGGTFGQVHSARAVSGLGLVALKTIHMLDDQGNWSKSRAEAAYRDVHHSQHILQSGVKCGLTGHGSQHFCHVFEVFYDTQGCWVMLAMEMADQTLLSDMRKYQQFAEDEVRLFIRGLLRAGLYCIYAIFYILV